MKLAGCLIKLNSKLCMDDAFLIIAVGLSLRYSTVPSWRKIPLPQMNTLVPQRDAFYASVCFGSFVMLL